nr:hypothetical protein Iba_chr12eCG14560 [Ipomoea batatas]
MRLALLFSLPSSFRSPCSMKKRSTRSPLELYVTLLGHLTVLWFKFLMILLIITSRRWSKKNV